MANPLDKGFRSLVRGFGEAASKAKPFYSGVDQAISAITQNKGTGQQMRAEILKTTGNARELRDRPVVRAALSQPKITKEQLQKIATDNPAPQFTEKTRGESAFEAEADRRAAEMKRFRVNEIMDEMNPDSLPQSAEQWKAARLSAESVVKDEEKQIRQNVVDVLHDEGDFYTKFEDRTIPGGTNDREILFQLPLSKDKTKNFQGPHYDEPNILAHARVSDRFEPNGDKALHVEELQSDLHQRARDIRKTEIKRLIDSGVSKADANKQVPVEYGYAKPEERQYIVDKLARGEELTPSEDQLRFNYLAGNMPPDSPFKDNWYELVMKRLLDDAVKNGYKKVYITPGAEQAKRYNLAKYISKIEYEPTEEAGIYEIVAYGKKGEVVYHEDMVNLRRIEELVGRDMARKIENDEGTLSSPNSGYRDWREFSGLELKSGGEGMLGFYDKMVPSFVNDYGAPHNMRMNLHDTSVDGNKYTVFEDSNPSPFSVVREGGSAIASRHGTREEAEAAAAELSTQPLHSITITPEFEKHVQEKGQRLYQAIPAGIGAGIGAEALTEEEPAPMKKGGPVSLDAMRLAVMNKKVQHKQYGGPTFVRSGVSRIRKNMNPVRGNTIIKEGGGNWMAGDVERGLNGLKRDGDPVLPNPTNQFVDKQLTKYVKNQMGTKDDPIRLAADAFPAQKAKLLAEKQVQIDKATADMEKARQSRGYTPEMMTESQKIIRKLEKEKELIKLRIGIHYEPQNADYIADRKRQKTGFPAISTTPSGQAWENMSDALIEGEPYRMRLPMVTPETAPDALRALGGEFAVQNPNAMAYSIKGGDLNDVMLGRNLGFNHMMDELRNATTPTSGLPKELLIDPKLLSKWTMPQAVEHVDKINAWRASQTAEANRVIANNAATFLHKDYPDKGMKWVELKMPKSENPADWDSWTPAEQENYLSLPNLKGKAQLADALNYEGEQLQTCVGGYCNDVINKISQIFSLRDLAGKSYATVEVKPSKTLTPEKREAQMGFLVQRLLGEGMSEEKALEQAAKLYPESETMQSIHQIKGKGNRAPSEEYLPYVQDFVRSGKWSDVKDLQNTGLIKIDPVSDLAKSLESQGIAIPPYATNEEITSLLKQAKVGSYSEPSKGITYINNDHPDWREDGDGMKRGGVVHMDAMRMAVMNKQLRKHHG